jgi:hypothetical protein
VGEGKVTLGFALDRASGRFVLTKRKDDRPIRSDGQKGWAAAGRAVGRTQLGRKRVRRLVYTAQSATHPKQAARDYYNMCIKIQKGALKTATTFKNRNL